MPAATQKTIVPLEVKRALRQPKFEGYKLRSSEGVPPTYYQLGQLPDIRQHSGNLPFQQFKRRATHNHLFHDPYFAQQLLYFGKNFELLLVRLQEQGIYEQRAAFITPTSGVFSVENYELPSLCFASNNLMVASSGAGELYVLEWNEQHLECNTKAHLLPDLVGQGCFSILSAAVDGLGRLLVLVLGTEKISIEEQATSRSTSSLRPVLNFRPTLLVIETTEQGVFCNRSCRLLSTEPPTLSLIDITSASFILGGTQQFVRHPDDNLNVAPVVPLNTEITPSYAWTQTSSDLTVFVTLPTNVTKYDIVCQFQRDTIQLRIRGGLIQHPFLNGKLFANIDPTSSVWTIEKGRLLTLYLEKEEQARWIQLKDQDDGVLETMDANELAAIKESMDRLTSDTPSSATQTPLGQNEEECDVEGVSFVISQFSQSGTCTHSTSNSNSHEWLGLGESPNTFLTKFDVDALVYEIRTPSESLDIQHIATFNAFGFVQASKRQKRLLAWAPDNSCVVIADTTRYVYVYYQASPATPLKADQYVVDLDAHGDLDSDIVGLRFVGRDVVVLTASASLIRIIV